MRPSTWMVYLSVLLRKTIPTHQPKRHFGAISMLAALIVLAVLGSSGCDTNRDTCASNPFCVNGSNDGGSNNTGGSGNGPTVCEEPFATCPNSFEVCDRNLTNDATNCGTCGLSCDGANQVCENSHCKNVNPDNTCTPTSSVESCDQVDNDCDGFIDEDFPLSSDDSNCGICGLVCPPSASCATGHCKWDMPQNGCTPSAEICNQIDDDCDGFIDENNNLQTDPLNCGICGHACGVGQSCNNGHCQWNVPQNGCVASAEVCDNTDNDCDGFIDEPFNLQGDALNCGTCGHACAAGQSCQSGHCTWIVPQDNCVPAPVELCNDKDDDCNGAIDEGFLLQSDPLNCGKCGRVCPGGAICTNGICNFPNPIDTCVASVEVCDNADNDCNGLIDNPFNLNSDAQNCGQCGHTCAAGQYCSSGHCANLIPNDQCQNPVAETCNNIDDDCDGVVDNGFNPLNDELNCGQCGTVCAAGQVCQNGHCSWITPPDFCVSSQEVCDGQDNNCNLSIDEPFNLMTDPANCGVCGKACGVGQTCVNAKCTWIIPPNSCVSSIEVCDNNDNDCDGVIDNGFQLQSDPLNCGTCGHVCPNGSTCQLGHCAWSLPVNNCVPSSETCDNVDNDCDGFIDNGYVLANDELNCGQCGNACAAGQVCQSGQCAWAQPVNICTPVSETCNNTDDNCNGTIDEGIDLSTDNANCGWCGHACAAGQHCEGGKCALNAPVNNCVASPEICNYSDDDCDGFVDEPFNLDTDPANCGWCGHACAAGQTCQSGHCAWIIPVNECQSSSTPETCNGMDDDCDDIIDEGFYLAGDSNNCGTCGHVCPGGTVCQNAKCTLLVPVNNCIPAPAEICNNADDDCDNLVDENFDLNTDAQNCGRCGNACAAGQSCQSGHCKWNLPQNGCVPSSEICDGIDNDCDGFIDENTAFSTDPNNCGTCSFVCAAGQSCNNGHCQWNIPQNSCVPSPEVCDNIDNSCNGVIDEPFNLNSNTAHCGFCGHACAAGQYCSGGHCAWIVPVNNCVPSLETCNNADDDCDGFIDETFNLASDPQHCGSCFIACQVGHACIGGICQ